MNEIEERTNTAILSLAKYSQRLTRNKTDSPMLIFQNGRVKASIVLHGITGVTN